MSHFIVDNIDLLSRIYAVFIMGLVLYTGKCWSEDWLRPSWQEKWQPSEQQGYAFPLVNRRKR
jgi:hypothetical protein